ncbi:MAG: cation diffusion facilitator family transporter [Thaumarchaeota archaeon]|nr:cation diffusion facilitator family transporter [Nitrososphaerota archaeon]
MSELLKGYTQGERLAKVSSLTLAGIGLVEIIAGSFTGSIGLTADGIDSMSDAVVSLLVWFGLKVSRKAPDERFNFGYYKVENMTAFVSAIVLIIVAGVIIYRSYLSLLAPKPVTLPALALVVLLLAGVVSLYRAMQMRRLAHKYNISSLRLDANNALKDGSASFLVFFTVLLSTFGFHYMDAVGGIAIGVFIITVSYVVIKQASLALLDAYQNPELVEDIRKIVEANGVAVSHILLRGAGPFIHAEIHVWVDSSTTIAQLDQIKDRINSSLRKKITGIQRIIITARSK